MKVQNYPGMRINPYMQGKTKEVLPDFQKILWEKIKEIDRKEKEAQQAVLALAKGEDIDPAEVAQRISSADASLKLLLRIRNKVLEAYQEIMRMQI